MRISQNLGVLVFVVLVLTGNSLAAQTIALGRFAHADYERNDPSIGEMIVDQLLARLATETSYEFVERAAVDRVLAEQALSQDGLARADGAARVGRLMPADLILTGTFLGFDRDGVCVVLEVIEPARAETVARVRIELGAGLERGHLAPLSGPDLEKIVAHAGPLLADAWAEVGRRPGQVLLKFLALPNSSGNPVWDDFGLRLEENLAEKTAASSVQKILRTHRPDAALPENELRLLGLAEADPDAWSQFADHYFWGAFEAGPDGLKLRMTLWSGDAAPRELVFPIGTGADAVDQLVADVSGGILAATRESTRGHRSPMPEDGRRKALAELLLKQSKVTVGRLLNGSAVPESAARPLNEAQRLAAAAIFFGPEDPASWRYLALLRQAEVKLYRGNARVVHAASAFDFGFSLFPRFLVGAEGKIFSEMLVGSAAGGKSPLALLEDEILFTQDNFDDVHQGSLLLRLQQRLRADFGTQMEKTARVLATAAPNHEDGFRVAAEMVLDYSLQARLDPSRTSRIIARLWPRLKVALLAFDAWHPSRARFRDLEQHLRDFLLDQGRFDEARALATLSADELAQALAIPPPPDSPAGEALRLAKTTADFLERQPPDSPLFEAEKKLVEEKLALHAVWRIRAELGLKERFAAGPSDLRATIAVLLRGPLSEKMEREYPALESYSAPAKAKHAAMLLAFYDQAEKEGYPPAVVAGLRARVQAWLAAPAAPAPRPVIPSGEQRIFVTSAPGFPAARSDPLLEMPPRYLHICDAAFALKSAVRNEDLPGLAFLLGRGAPVEAAGMAFVEAIERHRWAFVEYLLERNYDPAAPWPIHHDAEERADTFGALALGAAAVEGNFELMDRLLAAGVRFSPGSGPALRALAALARAADLPNLRKLLRASALPASDAAKYLWPVIQRRDLPMLEALLAAGAEPQSYLILETGTELRGGISLSENWSRETVEHLTALDQAAALNWREGVAAMLAAPGLAPESAFANWPHRRATDPAIRALLLGATLRATTPDARSSAPGINLACAIAADDVAAVAAAWKNPVARHFRARLGQSPLTFAIAENRPAIARFLADQGARLDDFDEVGVTPLAHAAALGDVDLVRFLAAKGADLNLQSGNGNAPLGCAIYRRRTESALALLDLGASISAPPGPPGRNPLFQAVAANLVQVVERLLSLGADPRAQIGDMTIFFPAARSNNPELIQRFVDLGCDLSLRGSNGWTPLVTSVRWGADRSTAKLLALGLRDPLAADAAVSLHQEWNSQFRPRPEELQTLHYRPDYRRCLELIQEQGRQVTGSAPAQERIFWSGLWGKSEAEVAEFLNKGGDVNFRQGPATPLQDVASNGKTEINDPKRNAKGEEVRTEKGDAGFNDPMLAWVAFLLRQGADPEAVGKDERDTAIVLGRRNPEIVRLLLDHKARIDVNTASGQSFFALALVDQQTPPATVRVLLDHGARIDEEARRVFAKLHQWQPERIPLIEAALTSAEIAELRGVR